MVDEYGLTRKQRIFADELLDTGVATTAALKAYDTEDYSTAGAIASQNLKKLKVQEYIQDQANAAAVRVQQLMKQDENLTVALSAAKDILDRSGHKPVAVSEINNPDGSLKTIIINKYASPDKSTEETN